MIVYGDGDGRPLPIDDLHFTNNLVLHNETGILGDGVVIGNAIVAYMRRETIRHNIIAGGDASRYPRDNFFLRSRSWTRSSWTGAADYRLKPSSPYASAANGHAVGAWVAALRREHAALVISKRSLHWPSLKSAATSVAREGTELTNTSSKGLNRASTP